MEAVLPGGPEARLFAPCKATDRLEKSTRPWQGDPSDRVWLGRLNEGAPATGTFSKWVGSTETEQAQYLVRSFLVFSKLDVTRAYIYFFDDKDEPQIHGSSGLTRNGSPKPAFHAVAHLRKTLDDYRFRRVVEETPERVFAYEYVHANDPTRRIWAVWSPTGNGRRGLVELKTEGMRLLDATRMPLTEGQAPLEHPAIRGETVSVECSESPVFLRWISTR